MAFRGRLLITITAGFVAPAVLAGCLPFSEQAPEYKLEGILNSLSLLRMKATLLDSSPDEFSNPLYTQAIQKGALMIIDCKMGVQSPESCVLQGISQGPRSVPDYTSTALYGFGPSMRLDNPASVTISAYKQGEQVCDDRHVKRKIGNDLADQAAELYDLSAHAGLLEPGSGSLTTHNKKALGDIVERFNRFWSEFGNRFANNRGGKQGGGISNKVHDKKQQRVPGGKMSSVEDEEPIPEPTGTQEAPAPPPVAPYIPYTVATFPTDFLHHLAQVGLFGNPESSSAPVLEGLHEVGRQMSLTSPLSSVMGMFPPPSFPPTSMSSFGLPQIFTSPLMPGSSALFPGSQTGFPFFPFSASTVASWMEALESGGSRLPSTLPPIPTSSYNGTARPIFPSEKVDDELNNFTMTQADIF